VVLLKLEWTKISECYIFHQVLNLGKLDLYDGATLVNLMIVIMPHGTTSQPWKTPFKQTIPLRRRTLHEHVSALILN
jgi:hypothetical protein